MKNLIKDNDDLTRVKAAFKIIKEIENSDEISSEEKNNFTVVRNYLANIIVNYITA